MDNIDSLISDEEEIEVDEEAAMQEKETNLGDPGGPNASSNTQKRSHEFASSDSGKETLPLIIKNLQVVSSRPPHDGWVKVSNKKGNKCRFEDSTHSG